MKKRKCKEDQNLLDVCQCTACQLWPVMGPSVFGEAWYNAWCEGPSRHTVEMTKAGTRQLGMITQIELGANVDRRDTRVPSPGLGGILDLDAAVQ